MSKTAALETPKHELLKAEAAAAGLSLPEYLLREHQKKVPVLSPEEWLAGLARLEPLALGGEDIVSAIHAGREERDRELDQALDDRR
jgi:hypothetical protein